MADGARAIPPELLRRLRATVGRRHVITRGWATRPYRSAYRMHVGADAVVVRPGSLVELWRVLRCAVDARAAIILQAANTGLTGGSSPAPAGYDRPVVIVSVLRLRTVHLVGDATQAVCLPGSTLDQLERRLKPLGREPHSVIGSSCLGASVTGGICNNSGGALVQRGPAYTELALFARLDAAHELHLVNHLGIALGDDPETMLDRLERGDFGPGDVQSVAGAIASDTGYRERVRDLEAAEPARFNADTSRLHDAAGCAGKVAVFAVRVDTFPAPDGTTTFYVGADDPQRLTDLRRRALGGIDPLPISAEYIHRAAFDIAGTHGRDIYLAVRMLGTRWLTPLFRMRQLAENAAARLLGARAGRLHAAAHRLLARLPAGFPRRLSDHRDRYEHHLLLKVSRDGVDDYRRLLDALTAQGDFGWFECTPGEARAAFGHRFAVAGAANNYALAHPGDVAALVTLDVALAPGDDDWHHGLPDALRERGTRVIAYGHFFCHVLHLDYLVPRSADAERVRTALKAWFDARGARYPAEHNFGQLYRAPTAVEAHYRALDPTNSFNPGVGLTSRRAYWAGDNDGATIVDSTAAGAP